MCNSSATSAIDIVNNDLTCKELRAELRRRVYTLSSVVSSPVDHGCMVSCLTKRSLSSSTRTDVDSANQRRSVSGKFRSRREAFHWTHTPLRRTCRFHAGFLATLRSTKEYNFEWSFIVLLVFGTTAIEVPSPHRPMRMFAHAKKNPIGTEGSHDVHGVAGLHLRARLLRDSVRGSWDSEYIIVQVIARTREVSGGDNTQTLRRNPAVEGMVAAIVPDQEAVFLSHMCLLCVWHCHGWSPHLVVFLQERRDDRVSVVPVWERMASRQCTLHQR